MVWDRVRLLRAWLAIVLLQQIGSILMMYHDTNHFADRLFITGGSPVIAGRALAHSWLCLLILRIVLLFNIENRALNLAHLLVTAVSLLHTALEVFYYKSMTKELPNISYLLIGGVTLLFFGLSLNSLASPPQVEPREKRKKQLFASHYMEDNILQVSPELKKSQ